jgi:hypothetical protein
MYQDLNKYIQVILLTVVAIILVLSSSTNLAAQTGDPIPNYLSQINSANLSAVATDLVTLYGPRREDVFSPYVDGNCTVSSTVYPKSTIEMSADYIKGRFEAMGYPSEAITMEQLPGSAGHNVYVTKVGSTYPNDYIEFSN